MSDLKLTLQYRTGDYLIARDFYERCLPVSQRFKRAVGYFATSCFLAAPDAYSVFFRNAGNMRVVCSPYLSRTDIELLRGAYLERSRILKGLGLPSVSFDSGQLRRSVEWLVAMNRLEIRIAVLTDSNPHIYHEKIGIFEDHHENRVAFTGSANETLSGLKNNFEVVDIFRSWEQSEQKRVRRKQLDFDLLWGSETPGVEVLSFPQAAIRGLIRGLSGEIEDVSSPEPEKYSTMCLPSEFIGLEETLYIPSDIKLFPHQQEAIRSWFKAKGRGVFEMATGSGKTIAALGAAVGLFGAIGGPLFILIICPYLHLVSQWSEVAKEFGLDPLQCAIGRSKWKEDLSLAIYGLSVGQRQIGSAVVTNATFASEPFQELLRKLSVPSLVIADEVHNMGAANLKRLLPANCEYRLGLSATPERWFDPEGSRAIQDYFGKSVVSYTIEQALKDGVLCPYRYFPVLVNLTEAEASEYYALSMRIARESSAEDVESSLGNDLLEALLIKRARLLATAQNKLPKLQELMSSRSTSTHNLVYCGDGTVEHPPDASVMRQMDAVTRILGHDLNMRVARYIAETPLLRREKLRQDFADGNIQCLVAIRCLDEGVDIPETRRAFILASSSNPRQFIQRRGRVLRRIAGKESAELFDFVVVPPAEFMDETYFRLNRSLLKKELSRLNTFARSAVNGPEAVHELLPLREKFKLLDVF